MGTRLTITTLCLLLLSSIRLHAQDYSFLKPGREAAWLGVGLAGSGAGLYLQSRVQPFTQAALTALDASSVPGIDRISLNRWSSGTARVSDFFVLSALALPAIPALATERGRNRLAVLTLMGAESYLLCNGLTASIKGLAHRTRPYAYYAGAPLEERLKRDARFSFLSGHTSFAACASFFTAEVVTWLHPGMRGKAWVWAAAATVPAAAAYMRIRAGKHFPTDVLAGYAVGALCGWMVPRSHRVILDIQTDVHFYPALEQGAPGMGLTISW